MNIVVKLDDARRQPDGLAGITLVGEGTTAFELDLPFEELRRSFASTDPKMVEFLMVASACYAIDKSVVRTIGSDVWTRNLSVEFPVEQPRIWSRVKERLESALSFLTGDVWKIAFYSPQTELLKAPTIRRRARANWLLEPSQFHAASLFSGGLDSLIGVIDFLVENPTSNLILVGHYDVGGPRSQQMRLYKGLSAIYPNRLKLVQIRISKIPRESSETTLRSRSIIFLALGLYAAASAGSAVPLLAPENGLIALNLPLTLSRMGSCSTRTMHPFYLKEFRSVMEKLGFQNSINNPLELVTKGESVAHCRNRVLLATLSSDSVSCSHATRRRYWKRRTAKNCGYCVPCLFRRAALHTIGADRGKDYGIDVCADELSSTSDAESSDDLRAVINAVRYYNNKRLIRNAITSIASIDSLDTYVDLVSRGISEIRKWALDQGSASFRKNFGVT